MQLRIVLDLISNIAKKNGISTPKLCGGIVRDRVLGIISKSGIEDLDLTTGDASIHNLAKEVTIALGKRFEIASKTMDDGHTTIFFGNLKIDFSSNFITPNIDQLLKFKGINNPTTLEKEMFSRDFTCNALLLDFDLKTITDPTNEGIRDIKNKIVRTCLEPEITFSNNKNRCIRAIYIASKLNFDIEENAAKWLMDNKNIFRELDTKYVVKVLNKSAQYNINNTAHWINKLDLWDVLPMTEQLYPYFKNRSLIKIGQFFKNYDYGAGKSPESGPGNGLWMNLNKYKSISDFRKKRRKKRKEVLKKIKHYKAE